MKHNNNILKWFNKELSEAEINDLKSSEDFTTLNKIAHYSSYLQAPKVDANEALQALKENYLTKKEVKVRTLNFRTIYKVAAVAVLMLCATYVMFFNNDVTFNTQIAQTETIVLPDDSQVILNATSSLSYNKKDWKTKRELQLDGQAFFKVSKGQKFTVNTNVGTVQVLGTQFDVNERANYFEVQCYEGIVAVTYANQTVTLTKGKTFRIINNIIENIEDFNALSPSWIQSESSFVNLPLSQVIAELERQYRIKIETDKVDTTQLFTGTFTHNNINIALQSVTIPLKLSYKIDKKMVTFYKYEEK